MCVCVCGHNLSCHSQKHLRCNFPQETDCQLGQADWAVSPTDPLVAASYLDLPAHHYTSSFFFFSTYLLYLVGVTVLPVCMYVYHAC